LSWITAWNRDTFDVATSQREILSHYTTKREACALDFADIVEKQAT
jgi:hypothetical protein